MKITTIYTSSHIEIAEKGHWEAIVLNHIVKGGEMAEYSTHLMIAGNGPVFVYGNYFTSFEAAIGDYKARCKLYGVKPEIKDD
jgi:hypothetical protein